MELAVKYLNDCSTIFQFLGHFFFAVKNLSLRNRDYWPSLGHTFYLIFLMIFLSSSVLAFSIVEKSEDYVKDLSSKTMLNLLLADVSLFGLLLELGVGLIQSYCATPLIKKFCLNSLKITEKCEKGFQYVINFKANRDRLVKHTIILVTFFGGTNIIKYSISKWHLNESNTELRYLAITCPMIVLMTLVMKFTFFVNLINTQLETLNKIILKTFPKVSSTSIVKGALVMPVKDVFYSDTTSRLQTITEIYFLIVENSELVNQSMGITLITLTSVHAVIMIAGTYRILMSALGRNSENVGGT